jgi:hypothetical protein
VGNVEKILKLVTSIKVKEKECHFFRLYVHLVLMDNLLFSSDAFRDKIMVVDTCIGVIICVTVPRRLNSETGDCMHQRYINLLAASFYAPFFSFA